MTPERLEEIVEKNQVFFNKLEFLAAKAIATGDWDDLYDFLNEARGVTNPPRLHRVTLQEFLSQGVDELHSPNAMTNPTTEEQSKGLTQL